MSYMNKICSSARPKAVAKHAPWAEEHKEKAAHPNTAEAHNAVPSVAKKKKGKKGPCWKGYEMIGMKKKGGRSVPNCVPKKK
jgi:hypothetical protein|tara:strand:+ start:132 stop:377 length:246 start_codon:yes stop_codon:yes gene_type:complete